MYRPTSAVLLTCVHRRTVRPGFDYPAWMPSEGLILVLINPGFGRPLLWQNLDEYLAPIGDFLVDGASIVSTGLCAFFELKIHSPCQRAYRRR
jgi:hypothetical protein